MYIESNLYKTTTLGTTQKRSSWTGHCLVYDHTFIKQPQTKSGCSWQVVSLYSLCEFIHNKDSLKKDLQFRLFWCHS